MAILIRNLFIFLLFTIVAAGIYGFWQVENRLRHVSYSEFRHCMENHDLVATTFKGNKVIAQHAAGDKYSTNVPNPEKLISELQDRNIKIIFEKDRSDLIFQAVAIIYILLLLITIVISLSKKKKLEEEDENKFATDNLILPDSGHKIVTFNDVAGIPEALEELQEIVNFLKNPKQFEKIGAVSPKGVLLQGPPGTGKTLLAQAIAGEAQVPFYSFSGSDFVEMFVGVGASRVRDIFKEAKTNAPCIIFIDEIDAVGGSRAGSSSAGGQDERSQTLNALLVEMDGFSTGDTIVVIAATNRPDILDSALQRPGRFDRQVNVLAPDLKGRIKILEVHGQKVALTPGLDIDEIAHMVPGFTGAELANLVNEAALMAARAGKETVHLIDFEVARDRILMGVERKGVILSEQDRNVLSYHEAGHAIVAKTIPNADPILKITIVPRGRVLGQTQQISLHDKSSQSIQFLKGRLAILMGGRAAEELTFQHKTSGAQDDIVKATEIATSMVCKWGMSDLIGPQAMIIDDSGFLDGAAQRLEMSDETSLLIDKEIKKLLDEAYTEALIAAGIKATHNCQDCVASDTCIHSKLKK